MLMASRGQANLTAPAHGDRDPLAAGAPEGLRGGRRVSGAGQPTETADQAAATAAYSALPAP